MEKKKIWELERPDADSFRKMAKLPLMLVVDNVRSLNNIGAMFRTCDAFLVEKVCLCGISATPPSVEIHKTALGAEDTVEWAYFADTFMAVTELRKRGYTVCALEQVKQSIPMQDFVVDSGKPYAIVVGNEVEGVRQDVVDACDFCIEIPQFGTKHSLNVSVSAALAIWHFFKQMKKL